MRKVFKRLLGFIGFLIIGFVSLGIFYYIYNDLEEKPGEIILSNSLSINYESGQKVNGKKSASSTVTIVNDSDEKIFYYIAFNKLKNAYDLNYKISDGEGFEINDTLDVGNNVVSSYLEIDGGKTKTYTFTFENKSDKKFSLEIDIKSESLETSNFADIILKNNEIKENPVTEVGKERATTNEGLIKSIDDFGTTYYFRGNVDNNNVSINGIDFKIVRINGDGSVKLILNDITGDLKKYYTDISKYDYKSSEIYSYLNNWVLEKLEDYSSYISNQKYCNDVSNDNNKFHALTRIKDNNTPSFLCLGTKVIGRAGLLTIDEAILAGAKVGEENKDFYLYNNNIDTEYYLMSSAQLKDGIYYPFVINKDGSVVTNISGENYHGVRPVITIIKTASVDGDGTVNNPYILTK